MSRRLACFVFGHVFQEPPRARFRAAWSRSGAQEPLEGLQETILARCFERFHLHFRHPVPATATATVTAAAAVAHAAASPHVEGANLGPDFLDDEEGGDLPIADDVNACPSLLAWVAVTRTSLTTYKAAT